MHSVLTIFNNRPVDGLLDNHARYARLHGYQHAVADGTHVFGQRQAVLYKYQAIYHHLVNAEDGVLLLVLDPFSVVYCSHALPDVAYGYDDIVTTQEPGSSLPAASGMIFRNTHENREKMRRLVLELGQWVSYLPGYLDASEVALLGQAFSPLPFENRLLNGYHASVQTVWDEGLAIDSLPDAMPLVAHNAPRWRYVHDQWIPTADYDFRYVLALVEEAKIIDSGRKPASAHAWKEAQCRWREPAFHMNPCASIAFVTLHTSNIAGYGDIHEESLRLYCERHHYGYHSYREPPAFLPEGVTANWAKLHLVRRHLREHGFVFWIDADVLAINRAERVDGIVADRDFVIGTDHTAWALNSCMFGIRNRESMFVVLDELCKRIESSKDRMSVYANGGDQQVIYDGLQYFGMLDARHIVDAMTLAASPVYATRGSRFIHFPAQHNHYRAVTMAICSCWNTDQ